MLLKYSGPSGISYDRVRVSDDVWAPFTLEPGDVIEAAENPNPDVFTAAPKTTRRASKQPDNAAPEPPADDDSDAEAASDSQE
jgi:hypothetical protein